MGSCCASDEGVEVVEVPSGEFSSVLEAGGWFGLADEVHGHVLDDGHVFGSVAGSEAGEIVVEDDIQDPVQSVLDVPVAAHGAGEGLGVEPGGGEIVALGPGGLAVAFGLGLDHGDHGKPGEAGFVGIAVVREQPGVTLLQGR